MKRAGRDLGGAVLSAALCACLPKAAEATPKTRLVYVRDVGSESCPEEMEIQMAVAARLGYDPFSRLAQSAVFVRVTRQDQEFHGVVEIVDERGISNGRREHRTEQDSCDELGRAIALSISIAIDPEHADASPPTALPSDAAIQVAPAAQNIAEPARGTAAYRNSSSSERARTRRRHTEVRPYVAAGLFSMVGTAPALSVAGAVSGGARLRSVSLGLELRAAAPASLKLASGGELATSLVAGGLVGCAHADPLAACAVGLAGALHASSSGVSQPRTDTGAYAAAGGRIALEVAVGDTVDLTGHVELMATLARVSVELDRDEVWRAPATSEAAALGVKVHFW